MKHKIKHQMIVAFIFSILPGLVMAQLPKHDTDLIILICKSAIEKKGYSDYTYKFIDVDRARSGNYGMSGQLHKHSKRFAFNCVFNKEIQSLQIKDLVISSLD